MSNDPTFASGASRLAAAIPEPQQRHGLWTLAILSTLMAFASISTDIYLPAMPAMGMLLFIAGSAGCAMAGSVEAMIAWRALQALDSGVKPGEVSEIITHLAFYAGWENAVAAADITRQVFTARGIDAAQLPQAGDKLLPSIRKRRQHAQRKLPAISTWCRREWFITRVYYCSASCGCGQDWRRATAAWSPSAH